MTFRCGWSARKEAKKRLAALRSQSFLLAPSSLKIGFGHEGDDFAEVGVDENGGEELVVNR